MALRSIRFLSLAVGLVALLQQGGACLCGHASALGARPLASHCESHGGAEAPMPPAPAHRAACPHCSGHALVAGAALGAASVPAAPSGLDLALQPAVPCAPLAPPAQGLAPGGARAHAPPRAPRLSVVLRI